jgi:hypothetical protein
MPQAHDHRRRAEPDADDHEKPTGEVDHIHHPTRTGKAKRVRYLRERLGIAPGTQGPSKHEGHHPEDEARKRRSPAPRG